MTQTGQKRKHEQAIQALLTTATIGEAAAQCGISERTLLRWLAESEFSEAYQKAKSDLLAAATGKLRFESARAVDVLATVARRWKGQINELAKAPAERQLMLCNVLGKRGDPAALPA